MTTKTIESCVNYHYNLLSNRNNGGFGLDISLMKKGLKLGDFYKGYKEILLKYAKKNDVAKYETLTNYLRNKEDEDINFNHIKKDIEMLRTDYFAYKYR